MEIDLTPGIEVCGTKDPMHTIDWLKRDLENYSELKFDYHFMSDYCIYEDSLGNQFVVKIKLESGIGIDVSAWNCDKSIVFGGQWSLPFYDFNAYPPTTPQDRDTQVAPTKYIKGEELIFNEPPRMCIECDDFFRTHKFVGFIARVKNITIN